MLLKSQRWRGEAELSRRLINPIYFRRESVTNLVSNSMAYMNVLKHERVHKCHFGIGIIIRHSVLYILY